MHSTLKPNGYLSTPSKFHITSLLVFYRDEVKIDILAAKHVLIQHQLKVITADNEEDFQRINVRRSALFHDAFRAFTKLTFKMLKVCFIGEPATVDDGGPRREFFSLLIKDIFSISGLFQGWPEHVCPIHDFNAVASNKFYTIGKMLATCLVQGGESPVCFCRANADYIVYDHITSPPCIDDIPDHEIRQLLFKVSIVTIYVKEP